MKKGLILVAALSLFVGKIFAQDMSALDEALAQEKYENDKTKTVIIVPEEQHITDKNASVKIEYSPMYDEVRIYYETLYVSYDRAEAMNTVMACLLDFQKDKQYYHYRYLKDDRERYYKDSRGQRKAEYSSYLKFSR